MKEFIHCVWGLVVFIFSVVAYALVFDSWAGLDPSATPTIVKEGGVDVMICKYPPHTHDIVVHGYLAFGCHVASCVIQLLVVFVPYEYKQGKRVPYVLFFSRYGFGAVVFIFLEAFSLIAAGFAAKNLLMRSMVEQHHRKYNVYHNPSSNTSCPNNQFPSDGGFLSVVSAILCVTGIIWCCMVVETESISEDNTPPSGHGHV